MSIKIEGDGNNENVFSDSDSGMPLWNGVPFCLLPPDLTKAEKIELVGYEPNVGLIIKPFTVPEDGWIIGVSFLNPENDYIKIDGLGGVRITPSQEFLFWYYGDNNIPAVIHNINCPYLVKKGQVVEASKVNQPGTFITFAPCMSV